MRGWLDEVGKRIQKRRKLVQVNHYRLTFRDEQGNLRLYEVGASTMRSALLDNLYPFYLVKIERIDFESRVVLGGRYYE